MLSVMSSGTKRKSNSDTSLKDDFLLNNLMMEIDVSKIVNFKFNLCRIRSDPNTLNKLHLLLEIPHPLMLVLLE